MAAAIGGEAGRPLSDQKSNTPPTASESARALAQLSIQPGPTTSSASQKANKSPLAARTPALRAAAGPRTAEASIHRMARQRPDHSSTTAQLAAVEPLSATTTSHGAANCWLAKAPS